MKLSLKASISFAFQVMLILVPLTWTASTSELFEFPKMLITYAATIVIGGLWLARMVNEKRIIFRHTPFELPLGLFLLALLLSTLFSVDTHTSLFGYYSRFNGGLFSMLAYSIIYFAAVSNFDRQDTLAIIRTLIISAAASALYAFPEHFGHSPSCLLISGQFTASCWVQDVQSRVFGTFGQPNWLAAYLAALLPLTLFTFVYSKNKLNKIGALALTGISFITILFTKSQSGIGAMAVMLTLSFIVIAFQKKKPFFVLGLFGIGMVIVLAKQSAVIKTLDSLNAINPLNSTTAAIVAKDNVSRVGGTNSMVIRRIVWSGAWELAKKHPFFGTGVETFAYAYYNVRPVEHNLVSEWDFLYNKAHNEFLNYAATTGFLGLGTYLLFLGSYLVWSLQEIKSSKFKVQSSNTATQLIPALLTGFIAINVSNFFGFSTVPVNILLFLFPALAILLASPSAKSIQRTSGQTIKQYLSYVVISLICILLLAAVHRGLKADEAYTAGKSAEGMGDYQKAISHLQDAIRTVSDEPLYSDELSLAASTVAQKLALSGQTASASEAAAIAVELSNRTLYLNKVHLNFYKTRIKVFINLAEINPRFVQEANKTMDVALKLSPTDAKLWFNRALLTQQLSSDQAAVPVFEHTIALKPDYELARFQFGQLLETLHEPAKAAAQYRYILENISPNNTKVQAALAEISK